MRVGQKFNRGLPKNKLVVLPHHSLNEEWKTNITSLNEDPTKFQHVADESVIYCMLCDTYVACYLSDVKAHIQEHEPPTVEEEEEPEEKKRTFERLGRHLDKRARELADTPEFFMTMEHEFVDIINKKAKALASTPEYFEKFEQEYPEEVRKCLESRAKILIREYISEKNK
jgi:hypothetical protein